MFSTKVIENLGFITPTITDFTCKEQNIRKLVKSFKNEKPALPEDLKDFSICIMPQFKAATFSSLVELNYATNLDGKDWNKILETFGKIAICDILIGNDDRLVKIDLKSPDYLGVPGINAGNVMLYIPLIDDKRIFKQIFTIDNASSLKLLPKNFDSEPNAYEDADVGSLYDFNYESNISNIIFQSKLIRLKERNMIDSNQPIILEDIGYNNLKLNLETKNLVSYICQEGVFAIQTADRDSRTIFLKIYAKQSHRLKSTRIDVLLNSYTKSDFAKIHEMEVQSLKLFRTILNS